MTRDIRNMGAAAATAGTGAQLVPQPQGGALRLGGNPGNKGGGKPKEVIRKRLRRMLGKSLEILERDLLLALHGKKDMPTKEVLATVEVLARYGLGTQQERESKVDETRRYVVRMPQRAAAPTAQPVAVVPAPAVRALPAPLDAQSSGTPGRQRQV